MNNLQSKENKQHNKEQSVNSKDSVGMDMNYLKQVLTILRPDLLSDNKSSSDDNLEQKISQLIQLQQQNKIPQKSDTENYNSSIEVETQGSSGSVMIQKKQEEGLQQQNQIQTEQQQHPKLNSAVQNDTISNEPTMMSIENQNETDKKQQQQKKEQTVTTNNKKKCMNCDKIKQKYSNLLIESQKSDLNEQELQLFKERNLQSIIQKNHKGIDLSGVKLIKDKQNGLQWLQVKLEIYYLYDAKQGQFFDISDEQKQTFETKEFSKFICKQLQQDKKLQKIFVQ